MSNKDLIDEVLDEALTEQQPYQLTIDDGLAMAEMDEAAKRLERYYNERDLRDAGLWDD